MGRHNFGVNGSLRTERPSSSSSCAAPPRKPVSIKQDALVVELGAGSLSKTRLLLNALARLAGDAKSDDAGSVRYLALDLERASLASTLDELARAEPDNVELAQDAKALAFSSHSDASLDERGQRGPKVLIGGLEATYDEGLEFLRRASLSSASTTSSASAELSRAASASSSSDDDLSRSHRGRAIDGAAGAERETSLASSLGATSTAETTATDITRPSSTTSSSTKAEPNMRKSLLWLGSSIGNLSRDDAAAFLSGIARDNLATGDTMLLGIDGCEDPDRVKLAYDDPKGVTREFILTGLDECGRAIGQQDALSRAKWEYVSSYNKEEGRHEAHLRCVASQGVTVKLPADGDLAATEVTFARGDMLAIEVSHKYTPAQAADLFDKAGLRLIQTWRDPADDVHRLYLVERAPVHFPSTRGLAYPVARTPTMDDWRELWKAWDTLTLEMIPREALMHAPIDLRHIILFYLGHIPAFADIHLARHFGAPHTEPRHFAELFERGIDPDMATRECTHSHSEVPTEEQGWPSLGEILAFEARVRERIARVYADVPSMTRRLGRMLAMIYEHEALHLETLGYIALQTCETLNRPSAWHVPDFASLAAAVAPDEVLEFARQTVVLGHDDDDRADGELPWDDKHEYGWDAEHPAREVDVAPFRIDAVPVTNAAYLAFLRDKVGRGEAIEELIPSSWSTRGEVLLEDVRIKTLYGLVAFEHAASWATTASGVQLAAFAASKGGRLPTQAEMRAYHKQFPVDVPASNVGLRNWHQMPATRDSDGGVWMWTSTKLAPHKGYKPSCVPQSPLAAGCVANTPEAASCTRATAPTLWTTSTS